MIVAVIPARGASKRLPRKNLAPFAGRPLLAWSITAALASPSIGGSWVTTEDDEIAAVAESWGARVLQRPDELATDSVSTLDVVRHALNSIRSEGHDVSAVVLLQPTNPLRTVEMIEDAIERFRETECDSLISVSQRRLKTGLIENGFYRPTYPSYQQSRLMEPLTYENGVIYITHAACLDAGSSWGERIVAFPIPRPFDEVDIDEPVDLTVGECIAASVLDHLGH